jgi:hypothetical protein
MNPATWGPPLWRIMTDVAYKADRVQNTQVLPYVCTFFKSLAFLLPCKYCRQSYREYIKTLDCGEFNQQRRLTEWVWRIKEMVNDKLKKPPEYRLTLPLFLRRVNMCTHSASAEDVLDFMAVLGLNYEPHDRLKKKHMLILHSVLPLILPYPKLNAILAKYPLQLSDLTRQQSYLDWLYKIRQTFHQREKLPPLPPQDQFWKRYFNARAAQTVPVNCPYVLNDQSTWSKKM